MAACLPTSPTVWCRRGSPGEIAVGGPIDEVEMIDTHFHPPSGCLGHCATCSDRYDWRGPQTQRRGFGISPLQRVYKNSQGFRAFTDREQLDRVVLYVCGRHRRSECGSSPDLGVLSHSRHQPRLRAVLVTAPTCLKRDQAAFQSHSE